MNKLHYSPEQSLEQVVEKPKGKISQMWSVVSNKCARAVEKVATGGTAIVGSGILLSGCNITGVSWLDSGLTIVGATLGAAALARMHLKYNAPNERSLVNNVFSGNVREQGAGLTVRAPWEVPVFPSSEGQFRSWLTGDWGVETTDIPVPFAKDGTFRDKIEIGSGQNRAEVRIDWSTRVSYLPGGLALLYKGLGLDGVELEKVVEEASGDAIRNVMGQQNDIEQVLGNLGAITNQVNEVNNGQNAQPALQTVRSKYGLNVLIVQIKPEEDAAVRAARQRLRETTIGVATATQQAAITRTEAEAQAAAIKATGTAEVEVKLQLAQGVVGAAKELAPEAQGIAVAAAMGNGSVRDAAELGESQAKANQANAVAGAAGSVARRLNNRGGSNTGGQGGTT